MRVMIAAVGKLKDGGERDLCARYIKRFDQSGRALALGPLTVVELPESRQADAPLRKADEAQRLHKATAACDLVIALDEYGTHDTSETFANRLARWRDDGTVRVAFLIGGADGHGESVKTSAHALLSLGRMTLPHGLVRVILAEQLYRATTILAGHPYHRS